MLNNQAGPMSSLIECVPNFSEGRRSEVVAAIAETIKSVPGARLLDVESDPDHNRSVITFIGDAVAVSDAAWRATARAAALVDLNRHQGSHPRMGATDVIPFVPVRNVEMAECVEVARTVGKQIADELCIPVYLYEEAAAAPERRSLAFVRGAGFESLREKMKTGTALVPDYGPSHVHPTAGATAVGARFFLIAYNVYLQTPDTAIAKRIARLVRESGGGLPAVKALGMAPGKPGCAQVSMNLTDFRKTSIYRVFDEITRLAGVEGARIAYSEIVGLLPEAALAGDRVARLLLRNFTPSVQILEMAIKPK
jgi:glutamate formiminotransferase